MSQPVQIAFHSKLEELKRAIELENVTGNLDGLFSRYVLSYPNFLGNVGVSEDWLEEHRQTLEQGNYIQLAILGYALMDRDEHQKMIRAFASGISRLKSKDPFPGDRISFPFFPREFLGLALGIEYLESEKQKELRKWLLDVLSQRKSMGVANLLHKLMYNFIETVLSKNGIEIASNEIANIKSYGEFCLLFWGLRRGAFKISNNDAILSARKKVLEGFLDEDSTREKWLTAVIYFSVKSSLLESLDPAVLSPDHVTRLLKNFESAMRRWQWSETKRWEVTDEYDIQAILHLILRSVFDDLVYEEPTRKFGHTYSKIDFRIPSLKLLIEAKFVRKREEFKNIEKEIKIDSIDYLHSTDCKNLIVFIYDDSASVEEHEITIQSLKKIEGIKDVIIASRPSHLGKPSKADS